MRPHLQVHQVHKWSKAQVILSSSTQQSSHKCIALACCFAFKLLSSLTHINLMGLQTKSCAGFPSFEVLSSSFFLMSWVIFKLYDVRIHHQPVCLFFYYFTIFHTIQISVSHHKRLDTDIDR